MKLPLGDIHRLAASAYAEIRIPARLWLREHCRYDTEEGKRFLRWDLNQSGPRSIHTANVETLVDMGTDSPLNLLEHLKTGSTCNWLSLAPALRILAPRMGKSAVLSVAELLQQPREGLFSIGLELLSRCRPELVEQLVPKFNADAVPAAIAWVDSHASPVCEASLDLHDARTTRFVTEQLDTVLQICVTSSPFTDEWRSAITALKLRAPTMSAESAEKVLALRDADAKIGIGWIPSRLPEILQLLPAEVFLPILRRELTSRDRFVNPDFLDAVDRVMVDVLGSYRTRSAFEFAKELGSSSQYVRLPVAVGMLALGRMVHVADEANDYLLKRCNEQPVLRHCAAIALRDLPLSRNTVVFLVEQLRECGSSSERETRHYRRDLILALGKKGPHAHFALDQLLLTARYDRDALGALGAIGVETPEVLDFLDGVLNTDISDHDLSHRSAAHALSQIGELGRRRLVPHLSRIEMLKTLIE